MAKILVLISMIFILTGCDLFKKNILDKVENEGSNLQKCLVNKVLKSDCDEIEKRINILQLEINKEGEPPSNKQVISALELGMLKIKGDINKSIYSQVKNSLGWVPNQLNVELIATNFLIFTPECRSLTTNTYWQLFASRYKSGEIALIFKKLNGSCFDISDLQEKFSILTEEQVDKLKRDNIKVLKFDSWNEANQAADKFTIDNTKTKTSHYDGKPVDFFKLMYTSEKYKYIHERTNN